MALRLISSRVSQLVRPCVRAFSTMTNDKPLIRTNIGIFGAMNVGKSTLMNALTQQETSIVDSTPGTTADAKIAFMELHEVGPTKLFDTPGIDETGLLGDKKRTKVSGIMQETDVSVIVVDPYSERTIVAAEGLLEEARKVMKAAPEKKTYMVYNLIDKSVKSWESDYQRYNISVNEILDGLEERFGFTETDSLPSLTVNMASGEAPSRITEFISTNTKRHVANVQLLPGMLSEEDKDGIVLLNIPMDGETPSGRLLRPQSISLEALLRNFGYCPLMRMPMNMVAEAHSIVTTVAYRMDLGAGRSSDLDAKLREEERWRNTIDSLGDRLRLVITDRLANLLIALTVSQAMDCVAPWTMADNTPTAPITTFSIMMINYLTGGRLTNFIEGLRKFDNLKDGDRVLICEACNHDRIIDDIGTDQIPKKITERFGDGVGYDWAFGREYQSKDMNDYDLVIHCGGCMIDQQKMTARLADIESTGVPITNYGLVLSLFQSPQALNRVLAPWGLSAKF